MTGTDPAVEAAQRAWVDRFTSPDSDKGIEAWGFEKDVRTNGPAVSMTLAAREALAWAADVIAQEARKQWALAAEGIPGSQLIAQRLAVLERVVRGEHHA